MKYKEISCRMLINDILILMYTVYDGWFLEYQQFPLKFAYI